MGRCKYYDTNFDCCGLDSSPCGAYQHIVPCNKCERFKPITNYDRIKAMNKEELAELLGDFCNALDNCSKCPLCWCCIEDGHTTTTWIDWLNSEAEENE